MAIKISAKEYENKFGQPPALTPIKSKPQIPLSNKVANFVGAKGLTDEYGADIAELRAKSKQERSFVEHPSGKEVLGSMIQTGANFIPGAGEGAGFLAKTAIGAGTGYAFDVGSHLQQNKPVGQALKPGLGTAVGGSLPAIGEGVKFGAKVVKRLFKGLGSGLSGVSSETIDKIVDNPEFAQKASDKLAQNGNNKVLEENAKTVLNGVSKIRQEARKAYGEGIESLSKADIKPQVFRQEVEPLLEKYGSTVSEGKRVLSSVEFTDPKNLDKASDLIDKLTTLKDFNGKSLRKLADDIENSAYKVATSDERLSFNAFIRDLSQTLRGAINQSTGKLNEINKAFSSDMQLAEAVQDIFGSVDYKNLSEVLKASKKLETLFSQKGLSQDVVDKFLSRIGVNPAEFTTGEAVRQISAKAGGANSTGLSLGEVVREATSAVVTPQMVKNISIKTGLYGKKLQAFSEALKAMSPLAQKTLLNAIESLGQNQ